MASKSLKLQIDDLAYEMSFDAIMYDYPLYDEPSRSYLNKQILLFFVSSNGMKTFELVF